MRTIKRQVVLMDCGRASEVTRGMIHGQISEAGNPPFSWNLWN